LTRQQGRESKDRVRAFGALLGLLLGCAHAPPAPPTPTARPAVFYEVFVRSFADADGDGTGDLRGLTARLDVLKALGVDALWLMPIHPSPSYHGYDVTDYRAIHPDFGTLADFDALVAAAHVRGIQIVLDYVMNHASVEHPAFRDHPERFLWRDDDPGWRQPWGDGPVWHPTRPGASSKSAYYYGIFWSGMPDWNLAAPEVEAEHLANLRFWRARGVEGFRIDAARHLFESPTGELSDQPATHAFMRRMKENLPGALLVAEAWTHPETVATYRGEYDLAFAFDTAGAIKTALRDGLRADFVQAQARSEGAFPDRSFEATFLSNHDMERVMRTLRDDAPSMRAAAATLFALPGTPFIYYGEEIGMRGGPGPRDEDKRTPMEWDEVEKQRGTKGSLWTLYRDLIALRRDIDGSTRRPVIAEKSRGVTALLRGEKTLFVVNFAADRAEPFSVEVCGDPRVLYAEGLDEPPQKGPGKVHFPTGLAGRGFAFVRL